MNASELVGRTLTNIFETKPSRTLDGIPGPASYFDLVIEIDAADLYEFGAHGISPWAKADPLIPLDKPAWAIQNNFEVLGKRISRVIQRDAQEHYDGSLTLILENDIKLEHQTANGDQLIIDRFNREN